MSTEFLTELQGKPAKYDIHDFGAIREALLKNVEDAVHRRFPVENERYSLGLSELRYDGSRDYSLAEQKKALLEGRSLGCRLRGRWALADKVTGKPVAQTGRVTVVNVPYLTGRGTFVRNGHEMTVSNVMRLVPGAYARMKPGGHGEVHVNVQQGTGQAFRIELNPENGIFSLREGKHATRLYPMLRAMGMADDAIGQVWGQDLLTANKKFSATKWRPAPGPAEAEGAEIVEDEPEGLDKESATQDFFPTEEDYRHGEELKASFEARQLDPDSTLRTLGQKYDHVTPQMILDSSAKVLRVSHGTDPEDNRDSLEFQRVYGPAELFAERVLRDGGQVGRQLLWKATRKGNLDWMPSGALNPHVDNVFGMSGLARYIEGSSPLEAIEAATTVSRLGEGGVSSERQVTDSMRLVQDSFQGFIDPSRGPESSRIGLDMALAQRTMKGSDGLLYTQLLNPRNGKREWIDSRTAARANVALGEHTGIPGKFVQVAGGPVGVRIIPRDKVDYYLDDTDGMFSLVSNLAPLKGGVKGMRLLMAGKYPTQALPLVAREAPLVRSAIPAIGKSAEADAGRFAGAIFADRPGVVQQVRRDKIMVEYADGERASLGLYDNFPANRKGYLRSMPEVKAGDKFGKGQVLASSNYTDKEGNLALGTNLRTAYLSWRGHNFEDAVVISESAAQKLASENMDEVTLGRRRNVEAGKARFLARHPGRYDREQLAKVNDAGLVRPGQVVHKGDPMILALREVEPEPGTAGRRIIADASVTWDHEYPGIVTDVASGRDQHRILVRSNIPMQVADKLSNRAASKGVVAEIVPDRQMPLDPKGRPFEILMSPLGVVSRTNPAQMIETAYGKIAAQTGQPVELPSFSGEDMVERTMADLRRHRLSDTDDLVDPATGKKIPKVFNGVSYFYKLKHTAESKESGRGTGGYSVEDTPAAGGYSGSKRLGSLETSALVSHNAMEFLRDSKLVRGQASDDFWRDFRLGRTPTMPRTPLVHRKFLEHLRGAGINVHERKDRIDIFGMTGKETRELTGGREVRSTDTYEEKTWRPIEGGLFGPDVFGPAGDQWGYIALDEPVPNPIMKNSLRRILRMTGKEFDAVAEGRTPLEGKTGGEALQAALKKIDLDQEIKYSMAELGRSTGTRRDTAIKRYRALMSMKEQGRQPADFMFDRIPVLPPRFRAVMRVEGAESPLVSDSNYLYKALLEARDDLREAKQTLPPELQADARAQVYRGLTSVVGLSDPDDVKLQQKGVEGLLRWVFGKGSPKFGGYQRRVIGTSVDMVGRGTVTPNPALRLNQIGLPESQAWSIYEPFVVRGLVAQGYKATDAVKMTANKHPAAYAILRKSVEERPVVMTRAPVLHKFGIMGFWPVLTKGSTVQVSPSIVTPFNMDFDGDAVNFHVPVTRKAAEDVARYMMPERNLLDARKFTAHYKPMREYAQGLYLATRAGQGASQPFANIAEAEQAYRQGLIDVDTPIRIVEKRQR